MFLYYSQFLGRKLAFSFLPYLQLVLGADKEIKKSPGSICLKANPGCLSQGLKRKKKKGGGKKTEMAKLNNRVIEQCQRTL